MTDDVLTDEERKIYGYVRRSVRDGRDDVDDAQASVLLSTIDRLTARLAQAEAVARAARESATILERYKTRVIDEVQVPPMTVIVEGRNVQCGGYTSQITHGDSQAEACTRAIRGAIAARVAAAERVVQAAREVADDEAKCRYDHNDFCQAHYSSRPCREEVLRDALAAWEAGK